MTLFSYEPFEASLSRGIDRLGLDQDPRLVSDLRRYVEELVRWNRRYNLTAVREPEAMLSRHLLDSLSIAPWVSGERVLDVGSGAGLPGIPLALSQPQRRFDLLDASGKKARFLRHVVRTLEIGNVAVIERRLAQYRPRDCYDTVVARAFADLAELVPAVSNVTRAGGRLLAMRGRAEAPVPEAAGWRCAGTHRIEVPGLDAERHVSIMIRGPDAGDSGDSSDIGAT